MMNTLRSLSLALVYLTVFVCWSCQPKAAEEVGQVSVFEPVNTDPCKRGTFQLDPACAQQDFQNWSGMSASMQSKLPPAEQPYLVLGFHIPRYELDSMLTEMGPGADVWAGLAIRYDEQLKKNITTVIFAGKPVQPGGLTSEEWTYYDFSRPCPDFCQGSPFQQ